MDLSNVRSQAHRLFTQCQEPGNPYQSVAKSVRTLRNRLEEADEALSGTSFRPEDIRVLEAAGESKNVLAELDAALQRDDTKSLDGGEPEVTAADFIAQFSVVNQKLAKALEEQEQSNGQADSLRAQTKQSRASASTGSFENNRSSALSRNTSFRSSATSQSSHDQVKASPEMPKLAAIAEQKVLSSASTSTQTLPRTTSLEYRPATAYHAVTPSTATSPPPSITSSSYVDHRPSLASRSSAASLSPDLRYRDSRSDGSVGSPARSNGYPSPLVRAHTDPNQLGQAESWQLQPGLPLGTILATQFPMPPIHGNVPLSQNLPPSPGPPPATTLPRPPKYYIANPEYPGQQAAELPGDLARANSSGVYPSWQPVPPSSQHVLTPPRSPLRSQHPALREYTSFSAGPPPIPQPYAGQVTPPLSRGRDHVAPGVRRPSTRHESDASATRPFAVQPPMPSSMPVGPAPLDETQIDYVVKLWDYSEWGQAQAYLRDCHSRALSANHRDLARRIQHMLGVLASIQGHWEKALTIFLSVVRTAIADETYLDEGDCAAAYWLGDTYCLLNRPAEALTAYLIAEHSSLFRGTQLRQRVLAEQKACIAATAVSGNDWKLSWEREEKTVNRTAPDSIMNPHVLTAAVEQRLLDRARVRAEAKKDPKAHLLEQDHSRVMGFRVLGADAGDFQTDYRLKIGPSAFDTSQAWPLMFDPFFSMANVVRGRLVTDQCDLLSIIKFDTNLNMPKAGRTNKKTSFTHANLQWLVMTIRSCLEAAELTITETASPTEVGFVARYPTTLSTNVGQERIATWNFLTISLRRQTSTFGGKPSYVVEVAVDGLYSARIVRGDMFVDKGVLRSETERVRSMILDHLEIAAKQNSAAMAFSASTEKVDSQKKGPFSLASTRSVGSRAGSISSRG